MKVFRGCAFTALGTAFWLAAFFGLPDRVVYFALGGFVALLLQWVYEATEQHK